MKLDYITQLNPYPIPLSIGTIVKPKLKDLVSGDMSFDKFNYFEILLKATPKTYYTEMCDESGKEYWEHLSDYKKEKLTMFSVVIRERELTLSFLEIFNFFFLEKVVFFDNMFVVLKDGTELDDDLLSETDIKGVISEEQFSKVIDIIQQICCIADRSENIDDLKFKNNIARKLYLKMHPKDKDGKSEKKKNNINLSLPNLISAVSSKHPSINPLNVWDLTIFELLDSFERLQMGAIYDIESTTVSVWGNKDKSFDVTKWYKNEYDKK